MRVLTVVLCLFLVCLLPAAASAFGWIAVREESNHGSEIVYDTGGIITLQVVAAGAPEMNTVMFRLPIPDCPGLALVDVSYGQNLFIGSLEEGVAVTFVGCKPLPHVVATLTFASTGVSECCYLEVEPHPESASGAVEAIDCDNTTVTLTAPPSAIAPAGSGGQCGAPFPSENPSPPAGATDQPLNVTLDWTTVFPLGTGLCDWGHVIFFGTTPDPPQYTPSWPYVGPPYDVGPLSPNTTYYWKIRSTVCQYDASTDGPVWQFTTADPVNTEQSTWSRIKALYR